MPDQHQFPMRHAFLSIFLLMASLSTFAQKNDRQLQSNVEELLTGFNGQIGVYVKSLKTGRTVSVNADTIFPTASIVKVPILVGIMEKIETKELAYDHKLVWQDTLGYDPGEDIAAYLKPGTKIALSKVMMLMMTISDNNASLWLQSIAGGGTAINRLMDQYGYTKTRVNSRTPGREDMRSVYGWGQSTPREMAQLFEDIVNKKLISASSSDRMLRIMGRQYWDGEALSALPPDVFVSSKNGAVNASRDEVLYVNGKHPYILSIFTKNNKDISWEDNNEAWELTRRLSKLVWEHFNK
jgi:beta-lactamase class A